MASSPTERWMEERPRPRDSKNTYSFRIQNFHGHNEATHDSTVRMRESRYGGVQNYPGEPSSVIVKDDYTPNQSVSKKKRTTKRTKHWEGKTVRKQRDSPCGRGQASQSHWSQMGEAIMGDVKSSVSCQKRGTWVFRRALAYYLRLIDD